MCNLHVSNSVIMSVHHYYVEQNRKLPKLFKLQSYCMSMLEIYDRKNISEFSMKTK